MTTKGQEFDTLKPPHGWPRPIIFLFGAHTKFAHIREEPRNVNRDGLSKALCGLGFYGESPTARGEDGLCSTCVRFAQTKFGWIFETHLKRGKR